jgi:DNA-binding CsgD family transcriptional regulator
MRSITRNGILSPFLDGAVPADLATRIRAWLLHALASHALDNAEQAAASLRQAVDLAEPEENRRVDVSWPFLDELALAALDPAPAAVSPMPALIERLSERERAVLRYLPTMLTFVEIGPELYVSLNTTKSHVRSIYRKLGAGADGMRSGGPASLSCSDPEPSARSDQLSRVGSLAGRASGSGSGRRPSSRAAAIASRREATPSLR